METALNYYETPVQEIFHPVAIDAGVRLIVKREDRNHPYVSGNKWWKLKYNLAAAYQDNRQTLLTFGGAYSNHIYATAAAAAELGLKSIGIIRGEETLPLNDTLQFAHHHGMHIQYISRESYHKKTSKEFIKTLQDRYGQFHLIPEGGSNQLAVKGCAEFARTRLSGIDCNYICLPVGTGGTMAGIICGLEGVKNILGISVLKNGEFLKTDVENYVKDFSQKTYDNWSLLTGYDHGGYAKVTPELFSFIEQVQLVHHLPLDHVYTAKLFWAALQEIKKGAFKKGSTILLLHTGGLQGSSELKGISHSGL